MYARLNTTTCDPYSDRMRSWCDRYDPYCSLQGDDPTVHYQYFDKYGVNAADFIISKVHGMAQTNGNETAKRSVPGASFTPIRHRSSLFDQSRGSTPSAGAHLDFSLPLLCFAVAAVSTTVEMLMEI